MYHGQYALLLDGGNPIQVPALQRIEGGSSTLVVPGFLVTDNMSSGLVHWKSEDEIEILKAKGQIALP